MKIQLLPAVNGDCILVEHKPGHYFVIDGGYENTAQEYLAPRLKEIEAAGGVVDVMVVTHIDEDHISGIIKYMEMGVPVPVGEIWYNGYRHIQSNADPLPMSDVQEFVKHRKITKTENPPAVVPYSIRLGCTLSTWIANKGIPWNIPSGGKAMKAPMSFQVGDTKVHLLSPTQKDIEKLEKYCRKDLVKKGYVDEAHSADFWDDAFEWVIASEEAGIAKDGFKEHVEDEALPMKRMARNIKIQDRIQEALAQQYDRDGSVANQSSISFVLETADGVRALLLGDAHAETIIDSLKKLYGADAAPYHFDVVKLAHHGSFNNTSPALLDLIRTDKWLVSTNSATFHHPDIATLANIVTRSTGNKIYFNYELDICKELRKDAYKKYGFEIVAPEEDNPGMMVEIEGKVKAQDLAERQRKLVRGIITKSKLDNLTEEAKKSERLRMNLDLRNSEKDQSQRMLNAIEPGTDMPIHRHKNTSETVVCLRGHFVEYFYDNDGKQLASVDMVPGGNILNVPAGQWHSLESKESGTVLLECKDGPYEPLADEDILKV